MEEDVMAELDIMTDNLRNMDTIVTPSTKKSFATFHPEDYNLRKGFETSYNVFKKKTAFIKSFHSEGEVRIFIDPKCYEGIQFNVVWKQSI